MRQNSLLALVAAAGCASSAFATTFTAGNLVVMRVGADNPGGAGAVVIEEYTRAGTSVGNVISFPISGPSALSIPDLTNHDRHLHLSTDGRFLVFGAYAVAPSASDPSGLPSATVPRVVGTVRYDGTVDLSTRVTDAFDATGIRGVFSTDGSHFWVSGDNASGATLTGGLRYTTLGSSTTVNLSQVQSFGGSFDPDNVRDAVIAQGQLYDCSGSNASIGKGFFKVGTGLPTSGSQPAVQMNPADGASTSSLVLLDLDSTIPGVDVIYAAASAPAEGIRKYVKQPGGNWLNKGAYTFGGVDNVAAAVNANGSVTLFASNTGGVITFDDPAPLTGTLSGDAGTFPTFLIPAPEGFTIGGLDFTPTAPACYANCDASTLSPILNVADFTCFLQKYAAGDPYANCDASTVAPTLNVADFTCFLQKFAAGCP